ncbi:HMG box-containing protein C19G7.04 [Cyphellophora attinorum]|uniref:HMG box-containing protein C19G7.04 n=1 Tax=Cyphellophora attinorum TaxID=1664694 RepID=A0A0N1HFQ1_9EURO|nr:HMG box-containing protein C19G7.04 [Phialophora attinorum]KPI44210.1 HMG box-containing protein C19G7.04 [Phialophora attinorum]
MARLAVAAKLVAGGEHNDNSAGLRRSPRKKANTVRKQTRELSPEPTPRSSEPAARKTSRTTTNAVRKTAKSAATSGLQEISLPYTSDVEEVETVISSAQRLRARPPPSDIDAIASELDSLSLTSRDGRKGHSQRRGVQAVKVRSQQHYTSRFVLKEADCVDDYSDTAENEDEDTDLSGFIVDDDAELSFHQTAEDSSDTEYQAKPPTKPRRRLQRGRRTIIDSESDKENDSEAELAGALNNLRVGENRRTNAGKATPEVIDLTSPSPVISKVGPGSRPPPMGDPFSSDSGDDVEAGGDSTFPQKLPSLFDSLLRLSPPKSSDSAVPSAHPELSPKRHMNDRTGSAIVEQRPHTPTGPRTPPRLKSPSKLLSPSKKKGNLRSPHRQSTDAFWDLHTVNDWVDINSPKKAPIDSPRKNPLARFAIWSDGDEMVGYNSSSSSPPSPCASPTKPLASPEKAAQAARLAEKRAEKAKRVAFDAIKDKVANDLLTYLDNNITGGKLKQASASTGGVRIIWSKTLRTCAGRANYLKKVQPGIAPSPPSSPRMGARVITKDEIVAASPTKSVVHYHLNIELAVKVIDREERIVNTLSHEFCHMASYIISKQLQDQHGPDFWFWANQVVACLRNAVVPVPDTTNMFTITNSSDYAPTPRPSWRDVEITTCHNYKIDYKYVWVCIGRDPQVFSAVQEYLNITPNPAAQGCGAKYERHSKSLDTEKSRCGTCRGFLVQVKPFPRKTSPKKKMVDNFKITKRTESSGSEKERGLSGSSQGSLGGVLDAMVDVIDLSD